MMVFVAKKRDILHFTQISGVFLTTECNADLLPVLAAEVCHWQTPLYKIPGHKTQQSQ